MSAQGFASTLRRSTPCLHKQTRHPAHCRSSLGLSIDTVDGQQTAAPDTAVLNTKLSLEMQRRLVAIKQREGLKGMTKANICLGSRKKHDQRNEMKKAPPNMKKQAGTYKSENNLRGEGSAASRNRTQDVEKTHEVFETSFSGQEKSTPTFQEKPQLLDRFQNFNWGQIDEYAAIVFEKEQKKVHQSALEQRRKFKMCLDKQVQERRTQEARLKAQGLFFHEDERAKLAAWRDAEERKAQQLKEQCLTVKAEQDEQLEFIRNQRQEEAARQIEEARRLFEKTNELMREEEAAEKKVKLRNKKAAVEILKQNEECLAEKAKLRKREQLDDLRLIAENKRIEEKKDAQKREEMNRRLKRQKEVMNRMKESVIKQQDLKAAEDARKAQKHQEEALAKEREAEALSIELSRQRIEETKISLSRQIAEKRKIVETEKKSRLEEAKALQASVNQFVEAEKLESCDRRERNIKYKNALKKQIDDKRNKEGATMTATELRFNRSLLLKVEAALQEEKQKTRMAKLEE